MTKNWRDRSKQHARYNHPILIYIHTDPCLSFRNNSYSWHVRSNCKGNKRFYIMNMPLSFARKISLHQTCFLAGIIAHFRYPRKMATCQTCITDAPSLVIDWEIDYFDSRSFGCFIKFLQTSLGILTSDWALSGIFKSLMNNITFIRRWKVCNRNSTLNKNVLM